MKRERFVAALILAPVMMAIAAWFFYWFRRAAMFWGVGAAISFVIGVGAALCGPAMLFIKPIPVKTRSIATAYMLLFGLLAEGLFSTAGLLSPVFIKLRDCGAAPPVMSVVGMLYAAAHGKRSVLTRYCLCSGHIAAPMRIALISDVHMGLSVDEKRLQAAADRLSAENPDCLIIAGDLVDDQTSPEEMETACRVLGAVRAARGVWFVYGNHDVAARGPRLAFPPERYREALIRNGIHILDDKRERLEGLATLAGRLDAWGAEASPRLELDTLLQDADPALPIILIDHQPRELQKAAQAGITLQLSGHTHGGQIWPAGLLSSLFQPKSMVYGHRQLGGCHVVVSSGLGTRGSRLRSGCTAEVVLIDLLLEDETSPSPMPPEHIPF